MARRPALRGHIRVARFDHWVKNLFVLPGVAVALSVDPGRWAEMRLWEFCLGMLAVGLVASSNYVLNELLDAPFDRLHPLKRDRPVPAGEVNIPLAWAEWLVLGAAGMGLAWAVSVPFLLSVAGLWVMGLVYNVPPVRAKDYPFVDVLVEAVNNPIRFLAGWYLTGTAARPIASLLVSYWMAGCYLMALKRFAECRDLRSQATRRLYRRCFCYYNEQNLLVSILFYGTVSMLFFGAYMGRYRLEMALAFPLVAVVMAAYMGLAFKPDSAAQRPEGLLREPVLMISLAACVALMAVLLFVDIGWLHHAFPATEIPRGRG
jgi:4-hydroxybenzoate polyprenyltransferase